MKSCQKMSGLKCYDVCKLKKGAKTLHEIVNSFSTPILLEAMEANVQGAWLHLGRGLGAVIHDEPELLWFSSGLPVHLANGIVKTRFPLDAGREMLNEKLKSLVTQHVPMAWLIGPSSRPANTGSYLEEHGWALDDEAPGMAIDLRSLDEYLALPSDLTIVRVSDEAMLKTWLRTMIVGSELPEEGFTILNAMATRHGFKSSTIIHYYLGLFNEKPVATSLLYLSGGVAGIYNVATLPEVRHRGIGSALTVAPLLEARVHGYRIGTLQSSPMGLNLYRRLGFREYCTFHAYFWSGE